MDVEHMPKYDSTPGPWRIYEDGSIGSASVRRFPEMTVLQPGSVKGENVGIAMSNAHLIAAAPELLAACQRFLDSHYAAMESRGLFKTGKVDQCKCGPCVEARAAIAAAEGIGR